MSLIDIVYAEDQIVLRSLLGFHGDIEDSIYKRHPHFAYLKRVIVWLKANYPDEIFTSCYRCDGIGDVDCECGEVTMICNKCDGRGDLVNIDLYEDTLRREQDQMQRWNAAVAPHG